MGPRPQPIDRLVPSATTGTLTALVSTYNSEQFIRNRLDNLLNQTVEGMTIWVYDAHSEQGEGDVVRSFLDDPRTARHRLLYYRAPERTGLYAAWNHIISLSPTEYLTTANADDIVDPDYYRQAILLLREGYDLVYCPWFSTPVVNQSWPPPVHDGVSDPALNTTCGHFPVWRRSLHERYGMFDERFKVIGDSEWWGRLRHHGARFNKFQEPMGAWANRGADNLYFSAKDEEGRNLYQTEEWLAASIKYQ